MATWEYLISDLPPDDTGFRWEGHPTHELESEQPFWDVFEEVLRRSRSYKNAHWYYINWPLYALRCTSGENTLYIIAQMKSKHRERH